jgi:hypothetical protein
MLAFRSILVAIIAATVTAAGVGELPHPVEESTGHEASDSNGVA